MAITSITSVNFDKDEYSPYYRVTQNGLDLNSLVSTVTASGVDGDIVWLSLINTENNRPVVVKSMPILSGTAVFVIDIFKDAKDADGIFRAKQGYYTLVASDTQDRTGIVRPSTPFPIMAASATEFREQWLSGVQLVNERALVPQTFGITGLKGVSTRDVQRGGYPVTWSASARTLSFDGGPPMPVPSSGNPFQLTLWNDTLDQTAMFQATPSDMPVADAIGYLFVDYAQYDDHFLRHHIMTAYGELEHTLNIPPEPFQAVTPALASKYPYADRTGLASTYRPKSSYGRPVRIQLPYRQVLVLHEFGGFYGTTQVLSVPREILGLDGYNGIVNFVPSFNSVYPAPTINGFGGLTGYGLGSGLPSVVPQYWNFAVTYGLPNFLGGYAKIAREFLFRYAAVNVLQLVGRGRTDILAGESFGRDGGSLNRSFTNGQWGVYSDLIAMHMNWLQDSNIGGRKLKGANTGLEVSVAGE